VPGTDEEQRPSRPGGDLGRDRHLVLRGQDQHPVLGGPAVRRGGDRMQRGIMDIGRDQLADAAFQVAEKNIRWPTGGVTSRMRVTAGMKPSSAMWSASSSTVTCRLASVQARRKVPGYRPARAVRQHGRASGTSSPTREPSREPGPNWHPGRSAELLAATPRHDLGVVGDLLHRTPTARLAADRRSSVPPRPLAPWPEQDQDRRPPQPTSRSRSRRYRSAGPAPRRRCVPGRWALAAGGAPGRGSGCGGRLSP
jgi:hypothetical protein